MAVSNNPFTRLVRVLLVLASPATGTLLAADCPVLPLGASAVGDLVLTGCKAQDALPAAVLAGFGDLAPLTVQSYSIEIESNSVLTLSVDSALFPPFLILVTEQNQVLTVQVGTPTAPATVTISLGAGKYQVIAGSRSLTALGLFQIQASIESHRTCTLATLKPGTPASGELSPSDCRELDLLVPNTGTRNADGFRFTLTELTVVNLNAHSAAFYPLLGLVNIRTNQVVIDGSETNYGSGDANIFLSLPAGDYLLMVASAGDAGGAYTLNSSFEVARPCFNDSIGLPGSVSGLLFEGGCRMLDYLPYQESASLVQPFRMTVPRRALVTIEQNSADLDSYLQLLRDDNTLIAFNDDAGVGRNSRLEILLNPGEYKVLAGAFEQSEFGEFDLTTSLSEPPSCPVADISSGDLISGEITSTDCRIREMVVEQPSGFRAKRYRLTISNRGTFTVELFASDFLGGLALVDDSNRSLNLRLQRTDAGVRGAVLLFPGTYMLYVVSGDDNNGTFRLRTSFQ